MNRDTCVQAKPTRYMHAIDLFFLNRSQVPCVRSSTASCLDFHDEDRTQALNRPTSLKTSDSAKSHCLRLLQSFHRLLPSPKRRSTHLFIRCQATPRSLSHCPPIKERPSASPCIAKLRPIPLLSTSTQPAAHPNVIQTKRAKRTAARQSL